jgi:hypothetical protein
MSKIFRTGRFLLTMFNGYGYIILIEKVSKCFIRTMPELYCEKNFNLSWRTQAKREKIFIDDDGEYTIYDGDKTYAYEYIPVSAEYKVLNDDGDDLTKDIEYEEIFENHYNNQLTIINKLKFRLN